MRTEDGHIIQQCLDGDHVAFGLLVDKYKRSVYAIAFSRIRNYHDAQDITQEAFIKAFQNLHTLRRWDNFMGWIYRITNNLCKDWIQLKARRLDKDYVEDQKANTLDHVSIDSYEENMLYESINDSLESLPDIYREVLSLRYFGGMSVHEMSIFLGISPRTIDRRLKEAMSRLKEETLTMMTDAREQHELPGSFTFRIVELIKHIRINPSPSIRMIPWGLSIATSIIIAVIGLGMRFNIANKVLDFGEFPVEAVQVSDLTLISTQQSQGVDSGNVLPDLQNALFMNPQAEGGTWTKKADMLTSRFVLSTSVVNGKIYAIGGQIPGGARVSTVEEYDPFTDTWTKKADMPTARGYLSTSAVNGKIYAIGGYDSNGKDLPTVEEYDPLTDTWTKKTDMPTARWNFSTTEVNGKIYAIGGWRNGAGGELSAVEEYDPVNDKWIKRTGIPTNRQFHSASAVDGKIYVIGGWRLGSNIPTVEEYDPIKDEWNKMTNMPTTRSRFSAASVNGKIYAIGGGLYNSMVYFSTVEEYDPVTDKWVEKAEMPTARYWLSASAVNGKIYAIGGKDSNNITISLVQEYVPGSAVKGIDFKGKLPTTWGDIRTTLNK